MFFFLLKIIVDREYDTNDILKRKIWILAIEFQPQIRCGA